MQKRLLFRQLFDSESSTYTYILGDPKNGEGILIDPVIEQVERDLQHVNEMGLALRYCLDTHIHADHVTGASAIRDRTNCDLVAGEAAQLENADILLRDGEELRFGERTLQAIATPGHTAGCTSYYVPGMVFTGDTLLVRSCGRTDFQGGSAETLFDSIHDKLYQLPPDTVVYPAHDYLGQTSSSLHEEMQYNRRIPITQKKAEFVNIMKDLKLPYPQKMDYAVPANQQCGKIDYMDITPKDLFSSLDKYVLVDVRTPGEFEAGHIEGAQLATMGPELMSYLSEQGDKNKPIVFICRIGRRSAQAVIIAKERGFEKAYNLSGGMTKWFEDGLPIEVGGA